MQHVHGTKHSRRLLGQQHFDTNCLVVSTFESQTPLLKPGMQLVMPELKKYMPALEATVAAAGKALANYAAVGNPAEFAALLDRYFSGVDRTLQFTMTSLMELLDKSPLGSLARTDAVECSSINRMLAVAALLSSHDTRMQQLRTLKCTKRTTDYV